MQLKHFLPGTVKTLLCAVEEGGWDFPAELAWGRSGWEGSSEAFLRGFVDFVEKPGFPLWDCYGSVLTAEPVLCVLREGAERGVCSLEPLLDYLLFPPTIVRLSRLFCLQPLWGRKHPLLCDEP